MLPDSVYSSSLIARHHLDEVHISAYGYANPARRHIKISLKLIRHMMTFCREDSMLVGIDASSYPATRYGQVLLYDASADVWRKGLVTRWSKRTHPNPRSDAKPAVGFLFFGAYPK